MSNECSATKTYPQLRNHPIRLVSAADAIRIYNILYEGVVVERPCRLPLIISFLDQAWEVFFAQKAQDAIHIACLFRVLHKHPVPAQVVHNSY